MPPGRPREGSVSDVTPAHDQTVSHRYVVHYPAHEPRAEDPNYKDFEAFHKAHRATARCAIGLKVGFSECADVHGKPCPPPESGEQPGLELHHAHIEFALQNAVELSALEKDYPGVSNPDEVGAWVESGANFEWLCVRHHRGPAGAHTITASDFAASEYVLGLVEG